MGVSGCGKTTLANALAKHYQFKFLDADDFHTEEAKAMMAANEPITKEMRQQWIALMSEQLTICKQQKVNIVLAYSGLIASQRIQLSNLGFNTASLLLETDRYIIEQRLLKRTNHFAQSGLLTSQIETFEPMTNREESTILLNINQPITALVNDAVKALSIKKEHQGV